MCLRSPLPRSRGSDYIFEFAWSRLGVLVTLVPSWCAWSRLGVLVTLVPSWCAWSRLGVLLVTVEYFESSWGCCCPRDSPESKAGVKTNE